jgi:hypothetical protein
MACITGSVLYPTLYNLLISDAPTADRCEFATFADDAGIVVSTDECLRWAPMVTQLIDGLLQTMTDNSDCFKNALERQHIWECIAFEPFFLGNNNYSLVKICKMIFISYSKSRKQGRISKNFHIFSYITYLY